jgi:hypothetical protein
MKLLGTTLLFLTSLGLANTHHVDADNKTDFAAFKTFMIRARDATIRQPFPNKLMSRAPEIDPKLTQAIGDAIRSGLASKGLKEKNDSPDLIVNLSLELLIQRGEVAGDFGGGHHSLYMGTIGLDLTVSATNVTVWHGIYVDEEKSPSKLNQKLPNDVRRLLSEYPRKGKSKV